MQEIIEFLKTDNFLIILSVITIILFIGFLALLVKVIKIDNRYKTFMKKVNERIRAYPWQSGDDGRCQFILIMRKEYPTKYDTALRIIEDLRR